MTTAASWDSLTPVQSSPEVPGNRPPGEALKKMKEESVWIKIPVSLLIKWHDSEGHCTQPSRGLQWDWALGVPIGNLLRSVPFIVFAFFLVWLLYFPIDALGGQLLHKQRLPRYWYWSLILRKSYRFYTCFVHLAFFSCFGLIYIP